MNRYSHSNGGLQSVVADSGVVVGGPSYSAVDSHDYSTTSLPQSPSSRSPPTKKAALSPLNSYQSANIRMNGYGLPLSSSGALTRDNIAGPVQSKGWVCLKCYIWNSAGSTYCKNVTCHALAPAAQNESMNSSAPSSLSRGDIDQYRMRHAASSPSFELDCPPFSVASNLPKFHSSPNSRPLAPTHPTVYSPPISRDHLAIPAPSHNHLPPSPPHSPVPRYLPSNSVASISHAPSFSNDLPHPSLRYSWKCLNCTRTNSMDMPGCPYCGELAPWIER